MWRKWTVAVAVVVGILGGPTLAGAQATREGQGNPETVMLVVDTSGSMAGTKLDQAKLALETSVQSLGSSQGAGLRSYAGDCGDPGILRVPIGADNRDALRESIATLSAGGGTPTPDALRGGASDLAGISGPKSIVLISDGQSTCGDPCPTAEAIKNEQGIEFKVHTVGFQAPSEAESELACVAQATGGSYVSVDDEEGLATAINDAVDGGSPDACDDGIPDISSLDGIAALLERRGSSTQTIFDVVREIPIPCLNAGILPIEDQDSLLEFLIKNVQDARRLCDLSRITAVAGAGSVGTILGVLGYFGGAPAVTTFVEGFGFDVSQAAIDLGALVQCDELERANQALSDYLRKQSNLGNRPTF